MKYLDVRVTFAEIPDEICLCVSITNCPGTCKGCHTPELREDIGKSLNWDSLNTLIHINTGISCVVLMGGDSSPKEINKLAWHIRRTGLKAAWYSGMEYISKEVDVRNFDYIKVGPYIKEKGPLTNPTTNQKLWRVDHILNEGHETIELINITSKFWKDENKSKTDRGRKDASD